MNKMSKVVHVRIPEDTYKALAEVAKVDLRTIGSEIGVILQSVLSDRTGGSLEAWLYQLRHLKKEA